MAVTLDDFSSKWGPDVFSLNGKISLLHYTSKIKDLLCYEKINSSKVSTSSLYYVSFCSQFICELGVTEGYLISENQRNEENSFA